MRSDFFYSQIVLRGGSLETCSSRGIFRRTDKLHVGFRPNLDGGGVTAGALDSLAAPRMPPHWGVTANITYLGVDPPKSEVSRGRAGPEAPRSRRP
jgi:hypothetical protein